jgi:hypothetical protein
MIEDRAWISKIINISAWHPHGFHGLVIGTDGRKLPFPL